jgi:hypothetical protein
MLFREVDGQDMIGFKTDDSGRRVAVFDLPNIVFQKAPWYETGGFNRYMGIVFLTILLIGILLWPVGALIRKHYDRPLRLSAEGRVVRLVSRLAAVVDLAFLAAFVGTFAVMGTDLTVAGNRLDGWLRFLQVLGWLGLVGSVALPYGAVRSWMDKQRPMTAKIGDALMAAAILCYAWWVLSHNLLAFSLKY